MFDLGFWEVGIFLGIWKRFVGEYATQGFSKRSFSHQFLLYRILSGPLGRTSFEGSPASELEAPEEGL